jgi:hypothetical protein
MILKANVDGCGIYQYFECSKSIRSTVHFTTEQRKIIKDVIGKTKENNEVWDFTDRLVSGQEAEKGIVEFWLDVGPLSVYVFAYSPNYILNNEGKTIERI